eukprot:CAMPEP_0206171328 /NCGR_PEP_ID=MMETSP1474-20131121/41928_1 /ASSEMBLY_ACC=CAM_ASM_001110 /TAXON_ID=97495 /ORGANISM="Imantonia sp., Strain RCC918" /LENGTH=67 /DNA_ID=CAMNT_0053578675 /DNA_START=1 /DNA_END=200 /DNA_ORIENTATION=+
MPAGMQMMPGMQPQQLQQFMQVQHPPGQMTSTPQLMQMPGTSMVAAPQMMAGQLQPAPPLQQMVPAS